jgi:ribonucleotide reductase alpha subunit
MLYYINRKMNNDYVIIMSNSYVTKRSGKIEEMNFNKISNRIKYLVDTPYTLNNVDSFLLGKNVIQKLNDGIKTSDIDLYTAKLAATMGLEDREYIVLAGRIIIDNHHKNTLNSFSEKMEVLYNSTINGKSHRIISNEFYNFVVRNKSVIDSYIDYSRDFNFDYFGFATLERSYLLRSNGKIVERPQDLYMRVAIQIHMGNMEKILKVYDSMTNKLYTHATPTLFNSGSKNFQGSSCFLLGVEDSREGLMKAQDDCTKISKYAGGIGEHWHDIRSTGAPIRGTNGKSNGIIPFLREQNEASRSFDQGSKRKGSFAIYLVVHHPDIMKFLNLKKNVGNENERCRDLFIAVWVPDLFMKRVINDEQWSLFCPDMCPGLSDRYGDDYEKLYLEYESRGMAHSTIRSRDIWVSIWNSQKESGTPYICFMDQINRCSMQKNIGTIKSSNLCVSGDTKILTKYGYIPIQEIVNKADPENMLLEKVLYSVYNRNGFTTAMFKETGVSKIMFEVTTKRGNRVLCTPYHKFILASDKIVSAKDLKPGDEVITCSNFRNVRCLPLHHDRGSTPFDDGKTFKPGDDIPYTRGYQYVVEWIKGFFTSGYIGAYSIEVARDLKLLFNLIGVDPAITGRDLCYLAFRLEDIQEMYNVGIEVPEDCYREKNESDFDSIESINIIRRPTKTYCFKEPIDHSGVFNGLFLGNCAEINLYSDTKEYSVCNLASICLPSFVKDRWSKKELEEPVESRRQLNHEFPKNPYVDFKTLAEIAGEVTENLNNIIDKNWNPVVETARSNFSHRPIGIGVQGLADVFMKFRIPFESERARKINKDMFEAIYYGALTKSTQLAKSDYQAIRRELEEGRSYKVLLYPEHVFNHMVDLLYNRWVKTVESNVHDPSLEKKKEIRDVIINILNDENHLRTYNDLNSLPKTAGSYPTYLKNGGSPLANNQFHWELFGLSKDQLSGIFDWDTLRAHINIYGVKNSVVCAAMPTASTAQIMGSSSCFEPYVSNYYKRTTLAGEFTIINKYLIYYLQKEGLWCDELREYLAVSRGSIADVSIIPDRIKNVFKTVWEIKQKSIIEMARDRQAFIDQSQSMNLFFRTLDYKTFRNSMVYAWQQGLKTGCYYMRTQPIATGQNFIISPNKEKQLKEYSKKKGFVEDEEEELDVDEFGEPICLMCGS